MPRSHRPDRGHGFGSGLDLVFDAQAASDPRAAVVAADRALRLDRESLPAYYAKAAALARQGDAAGAEAALQEASRREPQDFLPYALLGDLNVRKGNYPQAAVFYGEALERNPREPALAELARDPKSALR